MTTNPRNVRWQKLLHRGLVVALIGLGSHCSTSSFDSHAPTLNNRSANAASGESGGSGGGATAGTSGTAGDTAGGTTAGTTAGTTGGTTAGDTGGGTGTGIPGVSTDGTVAAGTGTSANGGSLGGSDGIVTLGQISFCAGGPANADYPFDNEQDARNCFEQIKAGSSINSSAACATDARVGACKFTGSLEQEQQTVQQTLPANCSCLKTAIAHVPGISWVGTPGR